MSQLGKRVRTLTLKGMASYEEKVSRFQERLEKSWEKIANIIQRKTDNIQRLSVLGQIDEELTINVNIYRSVVSEFLVYLESTGTMESSREMTLVENMFKEKYEQVDDYRTNLLSQKDIVLENMSVSSRSTKTGRKSREGSSHTSSSNIGELFVLKQAKAAAATANAQYAEKEATLQKQKAIIEEQLKISEAISIRKKAELESDIKLLGQQKEAAQAVAEATCLEKLSNNDSVQDSLDINELPLLNQNQKVASYVMSLDNSTGPQPTLNASAPAFNPRNATQTQQDVNNDNTAQNTQNTMNDLSKFLLKKDILLSRLLNYDDKPENFLAWKASFKNITEDLDVSAMEELDLLIKWLGPVSSKQAKSIRAANTDNPKKGLERVWERLNERFGRPEMIGFALKKKLSDFPKLTTKDSKKLYELSDIVSEVESVKENQQYASFFSYFDSSSGVAPIVEKLPFNLQEKWVARASRYKTDYNVPYPPFTVFATFIRDMSKIRNDPCFFSETPVTAMKRQQPTLVSTRSTSVSQQSDQTKYCPLHKTNHHLNDCRTFKTKSLEERRKFVKDNGLCFKCCATNGHKSRDCKTKIKCADCGSEKHVSAMHESRVSTTNHSGENRTSQEITTKCTQICGEKFQGKSCAKIVLVRCYPEGNPDDSKLAYAIVDDQSNRSLAKSEIFDNLTLSTSHTEYSISSCVGMKVVGGRVASDVTIESLDGQYTCKIPSLLECEEIPDIREEIPTPEVAAHHSHLSDITGEIPPLQEVDILLLIGRDCIEVHHVLDQRTGPGSAPYAQKLPLGWVIVGEACLGKLHKPARVNVNKIHLMDNGRPSFWEPCSNGLTVEEKGCGTHWDVYDGVFERTKHDDKPAMSVEDREFLGIMDTEFHKDHEGKWTAPLPFREKRPELPNNRTQALKRAKLLDSSLHRNPNKMQHFLEFMEKILDNGHAEVAPELKPGEECWYLPIFGVYNSHKPGQIRAVFDSSAKQDGISLNDVLIRGPDLTNGLLGVLLRFRREPVAIAADIQQMFYSFRVEKKHRNYLRFFWYKQNNPEKPLIEYRMIVHVFGNSPSPAIATYGLRKSVEKSEDDVREFVNNDFYVDDGLTSLSTETKAIHLLKRTKDILLESNLKLHKIVSNRKEVMKAFHSDELAKDLKDINFDNSLLPEQRSLGVVWDLEQDVFKFSILPGQTAVTRRSILSEINSIFDPLGFLAPVTLQGKLILRDVVTDTSGWDDRVSPELLSRWKRWRDSLEHLRDFQIPRTYSPESLSRTADSVLNVFADASEQAISAAAYLYTRLSNGDFHIGFVMGKAKVAPARGHTIPRLELCAAVLATEIAETLTDELNMDIKRVQFFTDSKVVLGYIHNKRKRFYTYVSNRVAKIHKRSLPSQWNYIATKSNPADCATRGVPASEINTCQWTNGCPSHLHSRDENELAYPLIDPDCDIEIRGSVAVLTTDVEERSKTLGVERFERFSSWQKLVTAVACLKHISKTFHSESDCEGWHACSNSDKVQIQKEADTLVLLETQRETYSREVICLQQNKPLSRDSTLTSLDPFIDENGLLRIGGRLRRCDTSCNEKHPLIVSGKTHVARLLVRHFHEKVQHQGRSLTEGAIRSGGYWITGSKRLVSSLIFNCVKCRRLRRPVEWQKMADLPSDRLEPAPPFSYVGVDVFGPWTVTSRKTRGVQAGKKCWAVLFTCLIIRAIHIEVIEEMSASSFVNAMRRFVALRGNVKVLRSDRGTNFIGSAESLGANVVNVEEGPVRDYMNNNSITWLFNPPHASHMGGVWERMIKTSRRILDSMLLNAPVLTQEVLSTFLAEVCAIVNGRPIVPVSTDAEVPDVLSPSVLLNQKFDVKCPIGDYSDIKNLYKAQWRRVQCLADQFWKKWKSEFLQSLQHRRKWHSNQENIKKGDIVLVKDDSVCRNDWPSGRVLNAISSMDGKVRKVVVRVAKQGKLIDYTRPVTQLVLLLRE